MRKPRKNKPERRGLNLRITIEEDEMIAKLRNTHCVNVSQFIRKSLKDLFDKLERENG